MDTIFSSERVLTKEQISKVAALAEVIWHQHFTPIIGREQVIYMVEKFQSEAALEQQIANGYEYYQLFDGDEFCGYCGIHPENGKLFLSKLYIKKEARGRHIASHAMNFLKDICRERGISAIWLTCNKHNNNTLAIYDHLGFKIIDTQVADIGNGFVMDDYILELTVA
ncbi:MAG: GNAT family N-acetyltransferase [Schaedlerella sp.]|nr:GNAT family N-acetyltransferase [Lachnospiraceae bacterium]MDY4203485.1 GNAT family N-acetyltransferase [Schaedlerella sp.]